MLELVGEEGPEARGWTRTGALAHTPVTQVVVRTRSGDRLALVMPGMDPLVAVPLLLIRVDPEHQDGWAEHWAAAMVLIRRRLRRLDGDPRATPTRARSGSSWQPCIAARDSSWMW